MQFQRFNSASFIARYLGSLVYSRCSALLLRNHSVQPINIVSLEVFPWSAIHDGHATIQLQRWSVTSFIREQCAGFKGLKGAHGIAGCAAWLTWKMSTKMTLSGSVKLTLCLGSIKSAIFLMMKSDLKTLWLRMLCRMAYCVEVRTHDRMISFGKIKAK